MMRCAEQKLTLREFVVKYKDNVETTTGCINRIKKKALKRLYAQRRQRNREAFQRQNKKGEEKSKLNKNNLG